MCTVGENMMYCDVAAEVVDIIQSLAPGDTATNLRFIYGLHDL